MKQTINAAGFTVDLFAKRPSNAPPNPYERLAGRINYSKRHIDIFCETAYDALLTLLHEAGHMVDYNRRGRNRGRSKARREQLAYLYGWAVANRLNIVIRKDQWREFHED